MLVYNPELFNDDDDDDGDAVDVNVLRSQTEKEEEEKTKKDVKRNQELQNNKPKVIDESLFNEEDLPEDSDE